MGAESLLRWAAAAVDATLICFGFWWLHTVSYSWIPTSVVFVFLTVVWIGEFLSRSPLSETK